MRHQTLKSESAIMLVRSFFVSIGQIKLCSMLPEDCTYFPDSQIFHIMSVDNPVHSVNMLLLTQSSFPSRLEQNTMETTINRLNGNTNQHTTAKAKRPTKKTNKVKHTTKRTQSTRLSAAMAISAGCSTPIFALAMSTITGHVASVSPMFAILPFSVLACLLIVSTPHVAEAKRCIGWESWQAWSFAVALDAAITICELLTVWCGPALVGIEWIPKAMIFGCVIYSALLNTYVNLRHAKLIN